MFKRFSAGFAVGYVFGARAGQKRYEQMADLAEKVMDMPLVSRAAERAHDLATGENGRRLVDSLKERVPFTRAADEESDGYPLGVRRPNRKIGAFHAFVGQEVGS